MSGMLLHVSRIADQGSGRSSEPRAVAISSEGFCEKGPEPQLGRVPLRWLRRSWIVEPARLQREPGAPAADALRSQLEACPIIKN